MIVVPGQVSLGDLERIFRKRLAARLDPDARPAVEAAAEMVARTAAGDVAVYGVNTGFGKLASRKIAPEDTEKLQENLILSHCCGVGEPLNSDLTRLMMTLSRSIHEIVWGLFFVAAVGLGALAGVLALAVRSVGFIAKMTAESIEDLDPKPVEAIRAVGGSEFQVFLYAILPQVLPTMIGVIIFEWEINIRRSSILGLVGAGGLGLVFFRQLNTFNFHGVTTTILSILVLILFGELVSYFVRKAII